MSSPEPSSRPPSVTHQGTNLLGLIGLLGGVWWFLAHPELPARWVAVVLMTLTAAPILLVDVIVHGVHRRASTGIDWEAPRPLDLRRVATKWLGAGGCVGLVLAVYGLAPEYLDPVYGNWFGFLRTFGLPAVVLGLAYVAWLDRYLVDPQDGYWHVGQLMQGRPYVPARAADAVRGWVIKGFFLPLMFTYLVTNIDDLRGYVLAHPDPDPFVVAFDSLWSLGFLVDIAFTAMGYILSLRLFDTHIRSTEPTTLGWLVALVCYQPFWGLVAAHYVNYDNGYMWGPFVAPVPGLRYFWGGAILLTLGIYSASTVAFGCRFSNLTHRGVITGGMYRFTKHPAYWAKLTHWWLLVVPFAYRGDLTEVVRNCTWLAVLSGIYWLRGRTEEAHLSHDPAYVAYAEWINEHGVFAFLGRWFPFLAYRRPEGAVDEGSNT